MRAFIAVETRWTRRARRLVWVGASVALLATSGETVIGDVYPEYANRRNASDGFGLFSAPRLVLSSNLFQCTLEAAGDICADSELGPGGVFPAGTANRYIFNSGFQVAGITDSTAGPWAGDTVGAYLMDTTGGQKQGAQLTNIYDSLDPDDLENWPDEAYIADSTLFAPVLLGRKAASTHDTWVQYWDGDPRLLAQRDHPMGIKVSQRSMTWNYPAGNESVIYFLMEFENVTDDPDFQLPNELTFFGGDNELPDEGWDYNEVYVSVTADNDIGDALQNFATAIFPFQMGIAYHGGFQGEFSWDFPPSVYYPPFFTDAPGISGFKYLRSPLDPETGEEVGLTMISVFGFPRSPFFDPVGGEQLWRYLSGRLDVSVGDPPCSIAAEIQTLNAETTHRSICNVEQESKDIRFYQSSGPFRLRPGDASTVAVAYIIAPTVQTMPDGTSSGIDGPTSNSNANPPGFPSFHPGFASSRGCDRDGLNCTETLTASANPVKTIERGAGWVSYDGPPPTGEVYPAAVEHPSNAIDEFAVNVVPGSLLGRALVAQAVFENQFLLGFAPEPPAFYLIPGDNSVTIVWEPSATETMGDPFFEVAGDPESALYNPNYREFDVEGYRIWRGTQRGQMDLLEQFDYSDTRFFDAICETVHPTEDVGAQAVSSETGNVVNVIGYAAGETCPFSVDEPMVRLTDGALVFNNGFPGGVAGAGVTRMPTSATVDTAIVSDSNIGPTRPLIDSGVPFAYVDDEVTNNFTYFYSVTAFDLNSMASGPHTLRSAMIDQSTVPRADAPEVIHAELEMFLTGVDGERLNPYAPLPRIDEVAGTFNGPMPPTDAIEQSFAPLIAQLLPEFDSSVRIDSIVPFSTATTGCPGGEDGLGTCWVMHVSTIDGETETLWTVDGFTPTWSVFDESPYTEFTLAEIEVPFDAASLEVFDIPQASGMAKTTATFDEYINYSAFEGQQNRRALAGYISDVIHHGGSRWFQGTEESTADPGRYIRVGHLEGIDTVWAPIHHTPVEAGQGSYPASSNMQCFGYSIAFLARAADVRFTWEAGTFGEVRDVTHSVPVPFNPHPRASWGFLNTDGNGNGMIDWGDFDYLDAVLENTSQVLSFCQLSETSPVKSLLEGAPIIQLVSTQSGDNGNMAATVSATGQGFGLYVNGERYIFQASSAPADGTVWTLRTYSGAITAGSGVDSEDPGGYLYKTVWDSGDATGLRPPMIPGLSAHFHVAAPTSATGPTDLSEVHTVPDPYLASSRYDLAPSTKQLMFVNLPPRATIRIYTVTGVLVDIVNHDDQAGGGRAVWDVRNRNNQFVASGVYFFHVVTPDGEQHVGKFTILNSTS